jgi:hypothetical protein
MPDDQQAQTTKETKDTAEATPRTGETAMAEALQNAQPELPPKPDLTEDLNNLRGKIDKLDDLGNKLFEMKFVHPQTKQPVSIHDTVTSAQADGFKNQLSAMNEDVLTSYRQEVAATAKQMKNKADETQQEVFDLSQEIQAVQQKDPTINLSGFRANIKSLEKNFTSLHKWAVAGEKTVAEIDEVAAQKRIKKIKSDLGIDLQQNEQAA